MVFEVMVDSLRHVRSMMLQEDAERDDNSMSGLLLDLTDAAFVFASILFVLSLAGLSKQTTARRGNIYGVIGMFIAILITVFNPNFNNRFGYYFIAFVPAAAVGAVIASKVEMTAMPQTVAAFHSFVGMGASLVGISNYVGGFEKNSSAVIVHLIETYIGVFIGAITFTGSIVAFLKLKGSISGKPLILFGWGRHVMNIIATLVCIWFGIIFCSAPGTSGAFYLYMMTLIASILGCHLIMSIGGADMPVVVSMLNSYSGWACSASGFMLNNNLLIITGALVGSSGAILSYIMCAAMNRSFFSVILGGFGTSEGVVLAKGDSDLEHREILPDELVKELSRVKNLIIVPGYGMAVSRCQNELASMVEHLRKQSQTSDVNFCIHPVAGRLPGHMNVLLAEADVPYDIVKEMDQLNADFQKADLVLVVGANDIVNPAALEDPNSTIAGMPVCEVWNSKKVVVFKRSLRTGYAGIENPLFYKPNTLMCFGDARETLTKLMTMLSNTMEVRRESMYVEPTLVEELEELEEAERHQDEQKIDIIPREKITIGIVKETKSEECRVPIVPDIVKKFLSLGVGIRVQSHAGDKASFYDEDYVKAGAIVVSRSEAWSADIVIKVNAPTKDEISLLRVDQTLISFLWPAFSKELCNKIALRGCTALSIDQIPRITRAQKMDVLSSMGNIIGYRAVLDAACRLPRYMQPNITAAGSFPPARVLIVGVGVAGLAAIGTAKKLGAIVTAFDTRPACREQVESLGAEFLEMDFEEDGTGVGGYAKVMSKAFIEAELKLLAKQCAKSDIVITTALIPGKKSPLLITKEAVYGMKRGSVIMDLAAERGGNCELTKPGEEIIEQKSGVYIIGYYQSNIPSKMAEQSSLCLSHNFYNLINEFGGGDFELKNDDEIVSAAMVCQNGKFVWAPPARPPPPDETKSTNNNNISKEKKSKHYHHISEDFDAEASSHLLGSPEFQDDNMKKSESESPIIMKIKYIYNLLIFPLTVILAGALFAGIGIGTPTEFHAQFFLFVLAIIIGYHVVWSVSSALHTPLMSVTNAISGIIVLGSMLELSGGLDEPSVWLGIIGCFFSSINVVGGFMVTYRMLRMFHK